MWPEKKKKKTKLRDLFPRETKTSRRVDTSSGQVYNEISSAPKSTFVNGPSWVHESPYLPHGWEELSAKGAPSLKHIAMKKVLDDQRVLSVSLFEMLPWHIASYLWDCLGRCRKRTLYMWKLLATVYPVEFPPRESHRTMKIEGPLLPMPQYLSMVHSEALRWRTVLTLAASFAKVPDLVGVAEITNLVALEVATPAKLPTVPEGAETPVTALSDRIIRTWGELAQTKGAFAHLRVLRLRNQSDLSAVVMRYLTDFPALQLVIAYDCPGLGRAAPGGSDGWVRGEVADPFATLYDCYQESVKAKDAKPSALQGPVLDFQVGRKRRRNDPEVLIFRRVPGAPEPARKKLKEVPNGAPRGPKKAVMKARPGASLGGLLGSFM